MGVSIRWPMALHGMPFGKAGFGDMSIVGPWEGEEMRSFVA